MYSLGEIWPDKACPLLFFLDSLPLNVENTEKTVAHAEGFLTLVPQTEYNQYLHCTVAIIYSNS